MLTATTTNAVQADPTPDNGGPGGPSTDNIPVELMVYENVPSTGYVGTPLSLTDMDLQGRRRNLHPRHHRRAGWKHLRVRRGA